LAAIQYPKEKPKNPMKNGIPPAVQRLLEFFFVFFAPNL
jgi:hypothetical protein